MSTTKPVTLGGVTVDGYWNSGTGPEPVARVAFYTHSGQARLVEVDEDQLIRLISESADALAKLRARRRHVERSRKENPSAQTGPAGGTLP